MIIAPLLRMGMASGKVASNSEANDPMMSIQPLVDESGFFSVMASDGHKTNPLQTPFTETVDLYSSEEAPHDDLHCPQQATNVPVSAFRSATLTGSTYKNEVTGAVIDYYEVEVKPAKKQIYPDLPATDLYTYDGQEPEAVVRFTNNSPTNSSVHVHGQYNRAPFDGWAADYSQPGQYKDYYYPNAQNARTIWYHDHSEFQTGKNVYMGLHAFYLISDEEEQRLGLPDGVHDVPLVLTSRQYAEDGSLVYDTNNNTGLWGDVIEVNGQPWPYFRVEPRKYRFRMLDGAVSRSFVISLQQDGINKTIDFDVIGSDGGLFNHPVRTSEFAIAEGERYEIVVDFSNYNGKNITMFNDRGMAGNLDYAATDRIMRFVVLDPLIDLDDDRPLPKDLNNIPPPPEAEITKNFTFSRIKGEWVINGVGWADIENRILTRPILGQDEIWELRHGGGNASHPVHIHLVDFQILSRTGGRNTVMPYEAAGMKDVVWIAPGEVVRVVARYAPWKGVYMFHCHNLVHEDHDMLVAFNVTQLEKWGYDNTTMFIDPMEPQFRPKDIKNADYTESAIRKKLDWFYQTNAYNRTAA
ncbi:bilirubin oxidase [Stemphylium lycopersici]|uniref:Bilirubin oxidase n=1 Tax=Stemphylium lycopersici TaxID=183478 RepID=A0A364MUH7_STELY|nr:bilirubin oxidase [Stemphylium lycopersici]RAR03200.1 bilirubin oxidase [Stemphylium lycopersici]RAR05004.1 bilirubin oxidase [Stemphylium lycopersici]